eukprot:9528721-Alexandrium_andersonii.AAC.1
MHLQSHPAFGTHLREFMGGRAVPRGRLHPLGILARELIELRMETLQALGHSASGARPGLIPGFFEAFSEWAGDPD